MTRLFPPCMKCGTPTNATLTFAGLIEGTVYMCTGCRDPAIEEAAERRAQFEELLASGVDRKAANDIMIARIDGKYPS